MNDKDRGFNDGAFLEESDKQTAFIKCEGCGGNMVFNPQTQNLKCEHCGREDNFIKSASVCEISLGRALEDDVNSGVATTPYRCENCGASFNVSASEVSVLCPYCSTTHVVKEEDLSGIKPNVIYPFVLTKNTAIALSRKWVKRRIFAPRPYKKNLSEENLHGVYQPCFTFDSDTKSYYYGVIGERKTRTVKTSKGTRTETYIKWKHVSGNIDIFFDDITVSCGSMSQQEFDKIMPFDKSLACVYERKFLSGFSASHYTRNVRRCWDDAKRLIDVKLRRAILNRYNCDVVQSLTVNTAHTAVTYKYVLFPVYKLNYRYNKKDYPVMINGNNGKVTGKTPVSVWRVLIAVGLVLAFVTALVFAFSS